MIADAPAARTDGDREHEVDDQRADRDERPRLAERLPGRCGRTAALPGYRATSWW